MKNTDLIKMIANLVNNRLLPHDREAIKNGQTSIRLSAKLLDMLSLALEAHDCATGVNRSWAENEQLKCDMLDELRMIVRNYN